MSNRNKSLVILTPGFPASEVDSTCLPMHQHFVRSLNKSYPGLNVVVLTFQYPFHAKIYRWFSATVISINGRNKGGLARLLLRQKAYAALKKIIHKNDVIGLLSFWYGECAYIGKKFGRKYGVRHYCWLLGQDAKKQNRYPRRIPMEKDELVALSDFLQEEFEKNHGVRPARVIPPGNDFNGCFDPLVQRNVCILAAGSLICLKRYGIFLEVIAEIRKVLPHVKCRLAGTGPEKEKLLNMMERLELQDSVMFMGELQHASLLQLMQQVKVFLHPSSYEGFSGVCLEALSMGTHVVSFTKPMRDNIKQWHVVRTKNEMVRKTIEILQDTTTRYDRQIVFKMEDTVKSLMELYG